MRHGLNLKVYETGKAVWIYRYTFNKKRKEILISDAYVTESKCTELSDCGRLSYEDALIKALEMNRDLKTRKRDPKVVAFNQAPPLETLNDVARNYFEKQSNKLQYPEIPQRLYKKYIEKVSAPFKSKI